MMNDKAILKVKRLKKHFPVKRGFFQRVARSIKAVDGVDFEIETGKTLGLVGESGCGKSTVAKLILKLLEADTGKIIYDGRDIADLSQNDMKPYRKEMQIVFQDPFSSLNPRMTIEQSIGEGLRILGIGNHGEREKRVEKLLEMVGIAPSAADRFPHEFSGGQRQRIGIARALSVEPSLIICDEPVSALDVSIQAQILNLLRGLQDRLDLTYLFISHDLNVVGYLSDNVAVMYRGIIMEYAPVDALFENPRHPYTLALLSAVPDAGPAEKPKIAFDTDQISDTKYSNEGCRFRDLCPQKEPVCVHESIPFEKVGEDHFVRCRNPMDPHG